MAPGERVLRLDHVQIAAPPDSEAEAREYFGSLLGLSEIEKPAALAARGGVWFALAGGQLHVGVTGRFLPAAKAHPALAINSVQALEGLAQELEERGYQVDWDRSIPSVRRFFTTDPWGNRIEFLAS
jgi:glyoxalase/bleomycin resistance protein/dioxygenase superfamily protein